MSEDHNRALAELLGAFHELMGCHVRGRKPDEAMESYAQAVRRAVEVRDNLRRAHNDLSASLDRALSSTSVVVPRTEITGQEDGDDKIMIHDLGIPFGLRALANNLDLITSGLAQEVMEGNDLVSREAAFIKSTIRYTDEEPAEFSASEHALPEIDDVAVCVNPRVSPVMESAVRRAAMWDMVTLLREDATRLSSLSGEPNARELGIIHGVNMAANSIAAKARIEAEQENRRRSVPRP